MVMQGTAHDALSPGRRRTAFLRVGTEARIVAPDEVQILVAEPGADRFVLDLVLLPGFDLHDLSCLADIFDLCNEVVGRALFARRILGIADGPVVSSAGLAVTPDAAVGARGPGRNIVLLAGPAAAGAAATGLRHWLQRSFRNDARYIAIGDGCRPLLDSRLLARPRIAVGAELRDVLRELHPELTFVDRPFCRDRQLISCYGRDGTIMLALHCVARLCGDAVAVAIADRLNFGHSGMRFSGLPGFTPSNLRNLPALLRDTIQLMNAHVEEPLSTREIARRIGYSCREIQRQFIKHCGAPPAKFYKNHRLDRARRLLQQTCMSVTEVALATGFKTLSHFSELYARRFGRRPSEDRKHRHAWHPGHEAAPRTDAARLTD